METIISLVLLVTTYRSLKYPKYINMYATYEFYLFIASLFCVQRFLLSCKRSKAITAFVKVHFTLISGTTSVFLQLYNEPIVCGILFILPATTMAYTMCNYTAQHYDHLQVTAFINGTYLTVKSSHFNALGVRLLFHVSIR